LRSNEYLVNWLNFFDTDAGVVGLVFTEEAFLFKKANAAWAHTRLD
jgi:hypothetical protein